MEESMDSVVVDVETNGSPATNKTLVTVFTGYLGSGKTTIIMSLVNQRPEEKIVVLKNEFGSAQVDSALAAIQSINVMEFSNGCLCCTLVGQMTDAIREIRSRYSPDRIIVETSGSAFPAPIVLLLQTMPDEVIIDGIITVVDCISFRGYEDTSYTAKIQAKYTDLLLLNKWDHLSERELDDLIDHVNELNTDTPKLKWSSHLPIDVFFGLCHTSSRVAHPPLSVADHDRSHAEKEVEVMELQHQHCTLSKEQLELALGKVSRDDVYRIKGFLHPSDFPHPLILNWAFGRWTWSDLTGLSPNQLSTFLGTSAHTDNHDHPHGDGSILEHCSDGSHAQHNPHSGPWHRIRLTVMGHVGLSHSPTLRAFLCTLGCPLN